MATTPTAGMYLDILKYRSDVFADDRLAQIKAFQDYKESPETQFDVNALICYVVLLYSKDSILSKKPIAPLEERRIRAARMSELDHIDPYVTELIFDLYSEPIRNLIAGYLIYQNSIPWTERCLIEIQLQENWRLRMKPIQNKTSAPKPKKRSKKDEEIPEFDAEEQEQDDAYVLTASGKKHSITDHAEKYIALIKKYDMEIFGEHESIRDHAVKRHRKTLESMVDA